MKKQLSLYCSDPENVEQTLKSLFKLFEELIKVYCNKNHIKEKPADYVFFIDSLCSYFYTLYYTIHNMNLIDSELLPEDNNNEGELDINKP